jgi:prevent-host-death family protein
MQVVPMEVSITQFRRNLFDLVNKAMAGDEVVVTHKGGRFRIAPEKPVDKLSRITPMVVINPDGPGLEDESWKEEMRLEWEKDWESIRSRTWTPMSWYGFPMARSRA